MVARDHAETYRQASWLELLFDLSFVVAVAQAAIEFEHALAAGSPWAGLVSYLVVFAAIWWAWMAFTWFANVFDTDDGPYRLLMFVMIAGSLGLAAGVPQLTHFDFRIGVLSYVVMRFAYVGQWIRVLRSKQPQWIPIARRIIWLTTINQVGWILFLGVPLDWRLAVFIVWFTVDLATPFLAGWDARLGGHRHHIVERYGLFTIIVLGESIAAATVAMAGAIEADVATLPLIVLAGGALIIAGSLWWIYFDFCTGGAPKGPLRSQYFWGYMHFFVFAGVAAIGAGISLAVEWLVDAAHVALPVWMVSLVVGGSVAIVLLTIALIEAVAERSGETTGFVLKAAVAFAAVGTALAAPVLTLPLSVLIVGLMLAALVGYGAARQHRLHASHAR
jgi:low temperature requirement protein LtrA